MAFSSAISIEKYATIRFGGRAFVTVFPDTSRTAPQSAHALMAAIYKLLIFKESRFTSKPRCA